MSQAGITKQPTCPAELQQIDTEGSNLSGTPVVSGPIQQADGYWAYINTIGSVDEAGNVTADSGVTAKPQFPGSVTLEGTAQVGGNAYRPRSPVRRRASSFATSGRAQII